MSSTSYKELYRVISQEYPHLIQRDQWTENEELRSLVLFLSRPKVWILRLTAPLLEYTTKVWLYETTTTAILDPANDV